MPILQRPSPYSPQSPSPSQTRKPPHFSILYFGNASSSPYKLLLTNQYNLLESEFVIAEARDKEVILKDFDIMNQYLGSMLEGMRNAQIRVERMQFEQLRDLCGGVRERQMRENPKLYENESNGFLESVTRSTRNGEWALNSVSGGVAPRAGNTSSSSSLAISSVSQFIEQVEQYSDSIKRLKKYAQYLEKHKNKPAKHAEKSEKKIRASLEEMDRIERAVSAFVMKSKRLSKRSDSSLEAHQMEKTKTQFDEYKTMAQSYKSMDVVKGISARASETRPVSRDVYEEHAKRKVQSSSTEPMHRNVRQSKSSFTNAKNGNGSSSKLHFDPTSFAQSDSDSDDSHDGDNLEQQFMTGQKYYVSNATMSRVNVEEMIAREKKEELERIEADFNELVELNRDVNGLVHDSQAQIDHIYKNVTVSNRNIEKGTSAVKASKKYNLKNALVGGLLR